MLPNHEKLIYTNIMIYHNMINKKKQKKMTLSRHFIY